MVKESDEPTELPAVFIKDWMNSLRVKGEALAERMNTTPATVSRLINGKRKMTLGWLNAFSKALGVPVAALLSPPQAHTGKQDSTAQLKSALMAAGVDSGDLPAVMKAIRGFITEIDGGQLQSDRPHDQSAPASRRRESTP